MGTPISYGMVEYGCDTSSAQNTPKCAIERPKSHKYPCTHNGYFPPAPRLHAHSRKCPSAGVLGYWGAERAKFSTVTSIRRIHSPPPRNIDPRTSPTPPGPQYLGRRTWASGPWTWAAGLELPRVKFSTLQMAPRGDLLGANCHGTLNIDPGSRPSVHCRGSVRPMVSVGRPWVGTSVAPRTKFSTLCLGRRSAC